MIGFLCRCGSPNKAFQSFILMLSTLYVLVLVVCFGSTFSWQSKGQKIYPLSSGQKRWYEIIAPRCSLESKSTSRTGSPIVSFAKLLVTLSTSLAFTTASPLLGIHNCVAVTEDFEVKKFKIPYNHVNMDVEKFIGSKASVVFNMKLDDPQTKFQFPGMVELFEKFKDQGLNVLAFPTDQGYFEPDDDETCRAKAKEYLGFGDFPRAVVFDKVQ